jgi:hypothetical protein
VLGCSHERAWQETETQIRTRTRPSAKFCVKPKDVERSIAKAKQKKLPGDDLSRPPGRVKRQQLPSGRKRNAEDEA